MLGDRKEAEDVLQEIMLVIWNKSGDYDPQLGTLSSWAVALTRNKALDRLRARTRRLRLIEEAAIMAEDSDATSYPSANEIVHGRERAELLREAMKDLPADQRMAIELAFFTGLSQTDIAARLRAQRLRVAHHNHAAIGEKRHRRNCFAHARGVTPLRGWNAFEIEFAHVGRQQTIQQHFERAFGQGTFGALNDDQRADLRRFIDEVVEFHALSAELGPKNIAAATRFAQMFAGSVRRLFCRHERGSIHRGIA